MIMEFHLLDGNENNMIIFIRSLMNVWVIKQLYPKIFGS